MSIAFSYDSTRLISLLSINTVKIWDASNGRCLQTLKCLDNRDYMRACSVALSYDSTRLAWGISNSLIILWDIKSDKYLQRFEGHTKCITSVAFSYDSSRLASASYDSTVRIWDTSSGECLQTLRVGRLFSQISFDLTGSYLRTEIGTIDLSFLSNLNMLPSTSVAQYQGLALSLDGAWITYNSRKLVWLPSEYRPSITYNTRKLVWLPSEYRPSTSAVSGDMIGVGVGSGDVWIFKVDGPNAF